MKQMLNYWTVLLAQTGMYSRIVPMASPHQSLASSISALMTASPQTIIDYKGKHSHELPSGMSLPDKLKHA